MNYQDDPKSHYSVSLDQYLKDGIGWDANCFRNTDRGDMEQFAVDSFHAGWLAKQGETLATAGQPATFESELKSLINRYSKENGSDTPDFILCEYLINALNIFDISTNERRNWHAIQTVDKLRQGCPKPDVLKTKEERKAETLREIHKSPYGANLGINCPEIMAGLMFKTTHSPKIVFKVVAVKLCLDELTIEYKAESGEEYNDVWPISETRERFSRGEYWQVFTQEDLQAATDALGDYYKTRSHWEAEALKKRQFPVGGVIGEMRKDAGRQIMADIEQKTAETLHGFKKTYEFIPAGLWEEFNQTNTELAKLWADGKASTQEYKDLKKQANDLAACMNKVKKEAIENESAESMARMVANVKTVTNAFLTAAKSIKIFTDESREADAILVKFANIKKPITDKKGFLFLSGNEVFWLFHDGRRYLTCRWEGNEWVGWQTSEKLAIEAAATQLPDYLDQFIREHMPTT